MKHIQKSDFEFHFFGKPYSIYKFNYGKTNLDFGENEYQNLITGTEIYAIHHPDKDNKSSYIVYDVDGPNDDGLEAFPVVKNLKKYLDERKLRPTIFFSGSKGFHLYLFFKDKYTVSSLHELGKELIKDFGGYDTDKIKIEIFPKQPDVDFSKNKYGNHLKAPLSLHPKTRVKAQQITDYEINEFVNFKDKKNIGDEIKDLSVFDIVDVELISTILQPYFKSGERHKITLGVVGYLKFNGVDKSKVTQIFKKLIQKSGGDELDIFRVIDDTYKKSNDKLADLSYAELPNDVEETLFIFISGQDPDRLKTKINQIRSSKKQPHLKVDEVATKIIEFIKSRYRIFHDDNFIYMIYGDKIFTNYNNSFESLILSFGINTEESFARQVRKVILDYLYTFSDYSEPINYCQYKEKIITIFTKNSIVKVTEKGVTLDEEFLPVVNKKTFTYIPKEFRNIKLFDYLSKFGLSRHDVELIITWLVTQLFNEDINTKPILLIQGPPGSGKSTLANFLMRLIENRESKILAYTGKDDALIASLQQHKVMVLDNLEFITGKTVDLINAVVTGASIELRTLYTTNSVAHIQPKSSLIITSAHGSFDNDGAFQSRLIKIQLAGRTTFGVESVFWEDFNKSYDSIFSNLLDICSKIIEERKKETDKNYTLRMTDFIQIADILREKNIIWYDMEKHILVQQEKDKYNSPFLKIFMKLRFKEELYHPFYINDIFPRFRAVANQFGIEKLNTQNLGSKLLKTGIFVAVPNGAYKLLKPMYYSLEKNQD